MESEIGGEAEGIGNEADENFGSSQSNSDEETKSERERFDLAMEEGRTKSHSGISESGSSSK